MFGGDKVAGDLYETVWTLPAVYDLACALTALRRSTGVEPGVVIGHSLGEFAVRVLSDLPLCKLGLGLPESEAAAIFMAFYSNIFLQAFMLQRLLYYTPAQAGRLVPPRAMALAAVMVAAGRLTDTVDRCLVILSGLGLFALSCYASSFVTPERPASWPVWTITAR